MAHFRGTGSKFRRERRSEGGGRRFDKDHRSGFRPRGRDEPRQPELTDVICDKCGKNAQVPFKPSENKPVFCRDCFKRPGDAKNRAASPSISQLEQINQKLDRIMEALNLK
ncbi:hypothetical protein HYV82_06520 [Candidatus Woesearchaeota archaeon]|nr:hypothetical protein [Candidatus Woesearchaeota archaeon]